MLQIRMWSEGRNWFKYLAIEVTLQVVVQKLVSVYYSWRVFAMMKN